MRARDLRGRALRAGAFFDPSFLAARDLFAAVRFFAERLAGERFFVALARAGRLVVFFAEFARAAAFVRAGRFFFAVRLRGAALARVVRFFAVVLRGPVFLAVARRGLVPVDRFVPPAFVRVACFCAGAFRARDFVAVRFRAGGLRRSRNASGGANISSNTGGGVPAYSGCKSSATIVISHRRGQADCLQRSSLLPRALRAHRCGGSCCCWRIATTPRSSGSRAR